MSHPRGPEDTRRETNGECANRKARRAWELRIDDQKEHSIFYRRCLPFGGRVAAAFVTTRATRMQMRKFASYEVLARVMMGFTTGYIGETIYLCPLMQ